MRKPSWHEKRQPVFAIELNAVVVGKRRGVVSQVDDYIEDCSLGAAHEFGLFVWRALEMQTPESSTLLIKGDIALHEV